MAPVEAKEGEALVDDSFSSKPNQKSPECCGSLADEDAPPAEGGAAGGEAARQAFARSLADAMRSSGSGSGGASRSGGGGGSSGAARRGGGRSAPGLPQVGPRASVFLKSFRNL